MQMSQSPRTSATILADWVARRLALHTRAVLQGGFISARIIAAGGRPRVAISIHRFRPAKWEGKEIP
jgi:hypothetical protein